jgi:hypothetical protein
VPPPGVRADHSYGCLPGSWGGADMSLETFETRSFQAKSIGLINQANAIIGEYQTRRFTQRLGEIIKNGRRAGLIDWNAIEDRTRHVRESASWDSPAEIVSAVAQQYREDLWQGQEFRPELWIEKDALIGVIAAVCNDHRLPYFACRGNNSKSEQYKAGKRFEADLGAGLTPIVLHLGDHDPNGLDMTRDNRDRLAMFARQGIEVRRLALNMDQIERYRPPPNFAKESDTRYVAYAEKFGEHCWELDALDPTVIADLIRIEIEGLIDAEVWKEAKVQEDANRARLGEASENWAKVEAFLEGGP